MTNAIQFLNDQIASDEVWKSDHKRATECVNLEDTIKVGLSLFGLFHGANELWSRRVQSGGTSFDPEIATALRDAYKWWMAPTDDVLEAVAQFEKEGFKVCGAS